MSEIDYTQIAPRDVIGFHVFNPDMGMGAGKVVGMKRIRGEANFVCEKPDGATVNRPVSQVMGQLEGAYELCTEPWEPADESDLGEYGVDEDKIKARRAESWQKLADEFGITTDEVTAIVRGL